MYGDASDTRCGGDGPLVSGMLAYGETSDTRCGGDVPSDTSER